MNKRGISPIISEILMVAATVLMCAIIIVWAVSYVKNIQRNADTTINAEKECNKLNLQVRFICSDAEKFVIMADNAGFIDITGLNIRVLGNSGGYSHRDLTAIKVGEIKRIELPFDSKIGRFSYIEILPVINIYNKEHTCPANTRHTNLQSC